MESYKHLDKICREIFNSDKGITTYIDTMQEINDGNRKLPFWDDVLRKLKNYRYMRNMYVHDVDTPNTISVQKKILYGWISFTTLLWRQRIRLLSIEE